MTYAIATYFTVDIDGAALGAWSTLQGLGMKIATESRETGGVGAAMTQLPGRLSYTNIQLGRPVCAETNAVMGWLSTFATKALPTTAVITSLDTDGSVITTWNLYGVMPTSWTGPSFDVGSPNIATETLELAYEGFLL
jgi:phage tail-like protein